MSYNSRFYHSPSSSVNQVFSPPSIETTEKGEAEAVAKRELAGLTKPDQSQSQGDPDAGRSWPAGHRFYPDCLRENYARSFEWALNVHQKKGWFVSFTFKQELSESRAVKLLRIWLGRLSLALLQTSGDRLRWIYVNEMQTRQVIHFHLLIFGQGVVNLSRKRWESRWETEDRNTGFARIYDAERTNVAYLAKYIGKARGGAAHWGGYWQGLKTPASVGCVHSLVQRPG